MVMLVMGEQAKVGKPKPSRERAFVAAKFKQPALFCIHPSTFSKTSKFAVLSRFAFICTYMSAVSSVYMQLLCCNKKQEIKKKGRRQNFSIFTLI